MPAARRRTQRPRWVGADFGPSLKESVPFVIISASRRTDIPAFYAPWLRHRLEAGFCTVPNPYNPRQVSRVSLRVEDVDALVFWTRHARPLWPLLPWLARQGYRYYFQYTITGYGPPLERRCPPVDVAVRTFCELAARHPPGTVVWRYDPVILTPATPASLHKRRFAQIAAGVCGATKRVVVSLLSPYRKTIRRMRAAGLWPTDITASDVAAEGRALLASLRAIANDAGLTMEACAQEESYEDIGIERTKCIDDRLLRDLFGGHWPARKDPGQRAACGCVVSKDIGMVDMCRFGCIYCYATHSDEVSQRRYGDHDLTSPSLHGHHAPTSPKGQTVSLPGL